MDKELTMLPQPDDTSCGPTALHAIYRYHGLDISLETVIAELDGYSTDTGTLDVMLGLDALKRGFKAELYVYNVRLFDPTWRDLSQEQLKQKLLDSFMLLDPYTKEFLILSSFYHFIKLGGTVHICATSRAVLQTASIPVIAGVSATYLYQCRRENSANYDEHGEPVGHFVVVDPSECTDDTLMVHDPYGDRIDTLRSNKYAVQRDHFTEALMMGVLTNDASILKISPLDK